MAWDIRCPFFQYNMSASYCLGPSLENWIQICNKLESEKECVIIHFWNIHFFRCVPCLLSNLFYQHNAKNTGEYNLSDEGEFVWLQLRLSGQELKTIVSTAKILSGGDEFLDQAFSHGVVPHGSDETWWWQKKGFCSGGKGQDGWKKTRNIIALSESRVIARKFQNFFMEKRKGRKVPWWYGENNILFF